MAVALAIPASYADSRPIKRPKPVAGQNAGQAGIKTFAQQNAQARMAPYGAVAPGEYSDALASLRGMPEAVALWQEVTRRPYDADDPNYRDPIYSNSGGGSRIVAGRVTGVAAGNGYLFAAGANGGVFRKRVGTNDWEPISDAILAQSTGDLFYDAARDELWYATGEANTNATSYVGAGVYRLRNARWARFGDRDRVGGQELESRSVNQIKFDGHGLVYAATSTGLYRHSTDPNRHRESWQRVFLPNPASEPDVTKPYDNLVNDILIPPSGGGQVVLINSAWRTAAAGAYNGFYLSTTGGGPGSFSKVTLTGDIDQAAIANAEFAISGDGSRFYMVLGRRTGTPIPGTVSLLDGVFTATSATGPWTKIADYAELLNSGSGLKSSEVTDYTVGVQAWFNNFIEVDPADPNHIWVGLEEVFESEDAGATWKAIGPYWNFGFACYNPAEPGGGCPATTHPDQHSVAVSDGTVYIGNDGGVYSRPSDPAASRENANNNATDWANHNTNLRTLQYYYVGTGRDPDRHGTIVAGGLQDNGGSLLRPGARTMVSPFGGDGGDIIVNPRNGCEILDEYVFLALWMTKNCGQSDGSPGSNAIFAIDVPDINARFTSPFRSVRGSRNTGNGASERFIAGGNSVWQHGRGFSYTAAEAAADPSHGWNALHKLDATGARLVVSLDGVAHPAAPADPSRDTVIASWCGQSNCNSETFTRGVVTNWGGTWTELDMTGLPNRYPNAVLFDPTDPTNSTVYLGFNGFNRKFIEGPGAATKHVYRGKLTRAGNGAVSVTWTDLSTFFPDIPVTDIVVVGNKLVVGTDLGVLVADKRQPADRMRWFRLGDDPGRHPLALPLTATYDLHVSGDGHLYAATHGRGIWRTHLVFVTHGS